MKVENQKPQEVSEKGIDIVAMNNAKLQHLALMRILADSVKVIEEESRLLSLETPKLEEGKEGKKSDDSKGSKKAKVKDPDQILLEAYIRALELNGQIRDLSDGVLQTILERANQDINELNNLNDSMKEIQAELEKMGSKGDLDALDLALSELLTSYLNVISEYQANQQKQRKASKEHERDVRDSSSDKEKIANAKADLERTQKSKIDQIYSDLSDLAKKFPALDFSQLLSSVLAQGPIASAHEKMRADIQGAKLRIDTLNSQMLVLQEQQRTMINGLLNSAQEIKRVIESSTGIDIDEIDEQRIAEMLTQVIAAEKIERRVKEQEYQEQESRRGAIVLDNGQLIRPELSG